MRSAWVLVLAACSTTSTIDVATEPAGRRLVQRSWERCRVGDAFKEPGPMYFLALEAPRDDVLRIEGIRTQFPVGEAVSIRVALREGIRGRYRVGVTKSPNVRVHPEEFELAPLHPVRVEVTSEQAGAVRLRFLARGMP